MKIYNDITELIGKTPLVHIYTDEKTGARVVAKVESFNPAGSIKDRAALSMIEAAGIGIAMKNGREYIKEIADIITETDNNNDGLVPVLNKFI